MDRVTLVSSCLCIGPGLRQMDGYLWGLGSLLTVGLARAAAGDHTV
jgi:hypothetical protein